MSTPALLRRLQHQAGATQHRAARTAPQPPAPPAAPIPNVADPALRRLLIDALARRQSSPPLPTQTKRTAGEGCARAMPDRSLPGQELAPGLHLQEFHTRLAPDADPCAPLPLALLQARGITDPAQRRDLLFFDTETTGLAGGTGTRAFMIGAADWPDGCLRVRQLWISRLAAEPAMLEAFRAWLDPGTILVSYNGKSYDGPLLATRYRLARQPNPLQGLLHLDLLHPVRRRYRGVWENCRLATIERQLLAIVREDDLPGSEAPRAFLGYLRGGPATDFRRVLAHNHQDVVTLARLLERMLAA